MAAHARICLFTPARGEGAFRGPQRLPVRVQPALFPCRQGVALGVSGCSPADAAYSAWGAAWQRRRVWDNSALFSCQPIQRCSHAQLAAAASNERRGGVSVRVKAEMKGEVMLGRTRVLANQGTSQPSTGVGLDPWALGHGAILLPAVVDDSSAVLATTNTTERRQHDSMLLFLPATASSEAFRRQFPVSCLAKDFPRLSAEASQGLPRA